MNPGIWKMQRRSSQMMAMRYMSCQKARCLCLEITGKTPRTQGIGNNLIYQLVILKESLCL